jgi:hypothetical protein
MKSYYSLLLSTFLITACRSEQEKLITGKWQAIKLVECDYPVPIQTDLVNIEFTSGGKYIFNSTLNITEEGSFDIKKNYLFTHDKSKPNTAPKAVLIKQLDKDTLVLEMNYKGKEQWLTLIRDKFVEKAVSNASKEEKKSVIASVESPSPNKTTPKTSDSPAVTKPADSQTEVKYDVPTSETNSKKLTAREAYQQREERRKKEDEDRKAAERKRYEAYIRREIKRKKEEIDRLEDLKEREEARRLKKEVENLTKKL